MGKARIRMGYDFLQDILCFPYDTKIIHIKDNEKVEYDSDSCEIIIEHPDLPPAQPDYLPFVNPTFKKNNSLVEFVGWGFPKYEISGEKRNFSKVEKVTFCRAESFDDWQSCMGFHRDGTWGGLCLYRKKDASDHMLCTNPCFMSKD